MRDLRDRFSLHVGEFAAILDVMDVMVLRNYLSLMREPSRRPDHQGPHSPDAQT
jgi:hypothetical protein